MKREPIKGRGSENLYRDPRTEIIYYRQYKKGKGRIDRSTGTTKLAEAKRKADEFRLEFLGMTLVNRGSKLAGELWDEWVSRKRATTAKNTVASIEQSGKHLHPYIDSLLPDEITESWWEGTYIPQKRAETTAGRKFFNDRKWLSMFLHTLHREGVIAKVPRLIDPDPARAKGRAYTDDEIAKLLKHAGPDLRLQILMAVTMGMRLGEIMDLTWDRIDLERNTIHLRAEDTKIRKARTFGISDPVRALLLQRQCSGPLFPSLADQTRPQGRMGNKSAWAGCKQRAKVSGRFHWLRHTFLTRAFKTATNPALICEYAGLSLEEAQRVYLHLTHEDTRVVSDLVRFET